MKITSETYKEEMAASFRRRSHLRITIANDGGDYVLTDTDIVIATKTHDVDPISRKLPTESFEFSVVDLNGDYDPANPTGKWKAIDENAEISVEFGLELADGTTEWLDPDIYLLTGRPAFSGGVATFNATSRLRHLTNTYYKGVAGTKTLYNIAEDILQDSGITQYVIDASLNSMTTTAVLPIDQAQNLLQLVAHAASCALFTIGDTIMISPISGEDITFNDAPIELRDIALNGNTLSKIEPLYKMRVYRYTYDTAASARTLYESTVDVESSLDCHCEFDPADNISVLISGAATISNLQTYASAIDCTITGTGVFTITITGYPISSGSDILETIEGLNANGGEDTENNALITTETAQIGLSYKVASYLLLRTAQNITYRGSPEIDVMDGVYIATTGGEYATGLVLKQVIQFNGALSGQMIIKRLDDAANSQLYDSDDEAIEDSDGELLQVIGTAPYYSVWSGDDMDDFVSDVLGE